MDRATRFISAIGLVWVFAGCSSWEFKRVPPGQSLNVAMARKGIALYQPTAIAQNSRGQSEDPGNFPRLEEAELPVRSGSVEGTRNFFARGNDYLQAGKVKEAVTAFEKAVQADPAFPDAHYNLAVAYQQSGEEAKSAEEFKKFKALQESH